MDGLPLGFAAFDRFGMLRHTNSVLLEQFPIVASKVQLGASFIDILDAGIAYGQFAIHGDDLETWRKHCLSMFGAADGRQIAVELTDRRQLLIAFSNVGSGRAAPDCHDGHIMLTSTDITPHMKLANLTKEISAIGASRMIESEVKIDRYLGLGCAQFNLPAACVIVPSEGGLKLYRETFKGGGFTDVADRLSEYLAMIDGPQLAAIAPPVDNDGLHQMLLAGSYRIDEGDLGFVVFFGDHWGDDPLGPTDKETVQLIASWIGQEVCHLRDQIELQRIQTQLEIAATTDSLTGLCNRRAFLDRVESFGHRGSNGGPEGSLMLFDLDRFKLINDEHGHDIGDKALLAMSEILQALSSDGVVAARWGGEEFVLFDRTADRDRAAELADDVRQKLQSLTIETGARALQLTTSAGVAAFDEADGDIEALIKHADLRLYRAKSNGRNRVVAD